MHIEMSNKFNTNALSILQKKVTTLKKPISINGKYDCLKFSRYLKKRIKEKIIGMSLYENRFPEFKS